MVKSSSASNWLLIIDAARGDVLQEIKLTCPVVVDICWTSFQPQLTMLDVIGGITQLEVESIRA